MGGRFAMQWYLGWVAVSTLIFIFGLHALSRAAIATGHGTLIALLAGGLWGLVAICPMFFVRK